MPLCLCGGVTNPGDLFEEGHAGASESYLVGDDQREKRRKVVLNFSERPASGKLVMKRH